MLLNKVKCVRLVNVLYKNFKRYSSALYITGDKAQDHFALLTPYLDIEERFKNSDELENNVRIRQLTLDLKKISNRWNFFMQLNDQKHILNYTKSEILKEINRLNDAKDHNKSELDKLNLQMNLLKEDLQNLKEYLYSVEAAATESALKLPNFLHPRTLNESEIILHQFLECPKHKSRSNFLIDQDLLKFIDKTNIFLTNDAALFDLAVMNYCHDYMTNLEYTQFSNVSFAKSIVTEGCDCNYNNNNLRNVLTILEEEPDSITRLHLVGGASLDAFMGYFTRHSIHITQFPLKFFTYGRKYQVKSNNESCLLSAVQQNSLGVFVATKNCEQDTNSAFDELVKHVIQIYDDLGYHYRLCILPAHEIEIGESLRLSIQMYSNFLDRYVEVGHLSMYGDYISKRLLFTYVENKQRYFANVIYGNLLNVQSVLSCAIENNVENKIVFSSKLQQFLPL